MFFDRGKAKQLEAQAPEVGDLARDGASALIELGSRQAAAERDMQFRRTCGRSHRPKAILSAKHELRSAASTA
jgi:hypothetical protein